ncbi:LuxR family two component transcriptional regulator [Marinilabilia salmonicolor]|jgi:DNA-binding NarL/FixJ family response regulator|uniref:response regulator n=1 Tax=Marinilabilia salmonicolor TaxID=989 RepID=UPI000D075E6A|nr:response regulator transcription factor [Marinilabilia salmonicolor]PRY98815.1 LuxR family two component transcriptional regulator [Marinilabilia salmonicolor]
MILYIVDDHQLFREGLRFLLSEWDFVTEIREAESGETFLEMIKDQKPGIVLMDIELSGINGIQATEKCMQKSPEWKVIALSMYGNENYYTGMIDAGASGFLLKNSKLEDVKQAIIEVAEGNNFFSAEILSGIIQNINKKQNGPRNSGLTEREIEVLFNICKGLSNSAIAEQLNISKRTIDKHRENILVKTHSSNTAQMVVYAIKNKIFEI